VATALRDLVAGETLDLHGQAIVARADIPKGHKVAVRAVAKGEDVLKYGWPIGRATADIAVGDHVHVHNVETRLSGVEDFAYADAHPEPHEAPPAGTFLGYRRKNGRVGTRNEIWVLCTVGCVANTARRIAEKANARFAGRVDGVFAFPHPFGCSQLGDDLSHTRKLIAGLAAHPNAGGVLILGLGCENNQLKALLESAPGLDPERLRSFTTQMVEDELEDGLAPSSNWSPSPSATAASPPAVGPGGGPEVRRLGRLLGRHRQSAGRPHRRQGLRRRRHAGADRDPRGVRRRGRAAGPRRHPPGVRRRRRVIDDFKRYFIDNHQPIYENPSPGNIAGGITTLEEKSLGAVQKGGRAPLVEVLRYGEQVGPHGLTLLEAPGNDAVSSTALTAAGATVILFTTGRGTPLGFPAPTLKIASNSALAARKPGWIDFDAGRGAIGPDHGRGGRLPDGSGRGHGLGPAHQGRTQRRA
jgi:altronate hydrolase